MQLKGLDKLREKLPAYPERRMAILGIVCLMAWITGYLFLILFDLIPRLVSDVALLTEIEPIMPLLGSLFIAVLAFWLLGEIWNKRDSMRAEYGDLAYQKILPRGLAGVFLVLALILHAFTSVRSLPPRPPVNEITIQWSQSILPQLGVGPEIDLFLRLVISGLLILIGVLTMRSAILTFGFDYMAIVYLYFPEESEIQEHEIYSVIRHPTYLSIVTIGTAALFFRFSVYSIVLFLLIFLFIRLQIRREERELIERFGDGYREYMSKVPALLVRPRRIRVFFRFLRKSTT
ncbi:MAG: isoprenylcysteine carboxylmethyltransferase family protein [Candidatus Thorarchaeota archaeon]